MDNKPENSDAEDLDELFSEEPEEEESENEEEEEVGEEDVGGDSQTQEADLLKKVGAVMGRDFESLEDAKKHYQNLNSLVGDQERVKKEKELQDLKKKQKEEAKQRDTYAKRIEALEEVNEKSTFLSLNPDAEDTYEFLDSYAKAQGVSVDDAWKGSDNVKPFKDIAEGYIASKKDKDIGVNSRNRITPDQTKKLNALRKEVAEGGGTEAQQDLVKETLGLK
ncbi:MAG: hypothetical protein U9M90_01235 [Patescibacteria group bacterium]|nr:hypothetical protein [Patescibacteria group bacterium]